MKKIKFIFSLLSMACFVFVAVTYTGIGVSPSEDVDQMPMQIISYNCDTGELTYSNLGESTNSLSAQTYNVSTEQLSAPGYDGADLATDSSLQSLLNSAAQLGLL